jgi:hypothetical protein
MATPRMLCWSIRLFSTGKPSIAITLPIRNSQALGGLMKKALSERPVAINHMLRDSDPPPIKASAIGSTDLLPLATRSAAQSIGGNAR